MIFNIFLFLFAVAIILIIGGFAIDIPLFGIIGAILLIGLGGVVVSNNVEVKMGVNATNNIINGTIASTTTTDIYETYDWGKIGGTGYGLFFLILGVGLFIISLTQIGD